MLDRILVTFALILLLPNVLAQASSIRQLTGNDLRVGETHHTPSELADPTAPFPTSDGKLQIYGTGDHFLQYPSWTDFLTGRGGLAYPLPLYHPDGTLFEGHQAAWDVGPYVWPDKTEILYAGVMTPTSGRTQAHWPEDNWNRRIYAFLHYSDGWKRLPYPLFDPPKIKSPAATKWLGHCYGHHFITDEKGSTWIFYERVNESRQLTSGEWVPYRTEIYARRMKNAFETEAEEVPVFQLGSSPYPASRRHHPVTHALDGYLVEGPRPVLAQINGQRFYLMGFSSGDFPTDSYGINLAWSHNVTGPYLPILRNDGSDFLDLGASLRKQAGLSWGPARPSFFQSPDGNWWLLFHAVNKNILPGRDYSVWPKESLDHFYRSLYLAPVRLAIDAKGVPQVTINPLEATESSIKRNGK